MHTLLLSELRARYAVAKPRGRGAPAGTRCPGGAMAHCAVWRRTATSIVFLAAVLVAACGFQPGNQEIGYLKDGRLWTVNADGSYPAAIPAKYVLGFAWSPSHQQLVLRTAAELVNENNAAAVPSNLSVTSADGGGTVTITPSVAGLIRGDAWWDADGNRLLYAESIVTGDGQSSSMPFYVLSQPDQPAGIARVVLQGGGDIPAVAPDGSQVAAIDAAGAIHVGKPGTSGRVVATSALQTLTATNRPARVLWQPGHDALLYAAAGSQGQVVLKLVDPQGRARTIMATSKLLDYAFSPDGTRLLVQTVNQFAIWPIGAAVAVAPQYAWSEADAFAQAWWSPDGRYVLMRDASGLWLAEPARNGVDHLLTLRETPPAEATAATAQWHPLVGSPWSTDSSRFVFSDDGTSTWNGQRLPTSGGAGGLYIGSPNGDAPTIPRLLVTGNIAAPSWTYLDPGTSWLVAG